MNEEFYYLAFSWFLGIGPMRFSALVNAFGSAKKAYLAEKELLVKILGQKLTEKFIQFRKSFNPEKKWQELEKKNIKIISLISDYYPEKLRQITDPPICLFAKGDTNLFIDKKRPTLAIVGTRQPTPYGEQIAKKFSSELTKADFIIVSGMAIGIDTVSHWAAIKSQGKTIAVLGCGVDVIYPAVNRRLYGEIVNEKGVVVSEFPPGQLVAKGLFIARNRIIAGLSDGVLIVEGAKDSGALITAKFAAEQGREVFAPPAPLTSEMSQAPNLLLKQGAKLVTGVEDIFEELNIKIIPQKKQEIEKKLSEKERLIFAALQKEPLFIDEIVLATGMTINEVLNTVSLLEIKKIIEKNSQSKYQIKI
ncbi:MAG: DNA-processing protein DprA [Patescibacteria group bacterium]|nr:DNA-processing protein DprA [Patescibacteria group bacterium]